VAIRIPCTSLSRKEKTYAQLVLRATRSGLRRFEGGVYFRCGSTVEESALHPEGYPETPLIIEYAGSDRAGGMHYRPNGYGRKVYRDIHILWRFDAARGEWDQLARVLSQGPEWVDDIAAIVRREIAAPPVNFVEASRHVATCVLELLDRELSELEEEGRGRAMSFLYDQFTARFVSETSWQATRPS
jgi:hypothetical protein